MADSWLVRHHLAGLGVLNPEEMRDVAEDAVAFVAASRRAAPLHVSLAMRMLEVSFQTLRLLLLAPAPATPGAYRLVAVWSGLPGPTAGLLRFYATLTLLRAFDHPTVRLRLALPDAAARFAVKRAEREALRRRATAPADAAP